MIVYNDIMKKLSDSGYSSYRLQKENIISGSTLDRIRANDSISTNTIDTICTICKCQPGDIISWVPATKGKD